MSTKFKGSKSLVLVRRGFSLDPRTGDYVAETEYQGTQLAVMGQSAQAAAGRLDHQATLQDGYGSIIYRQQVTTPPPGEEGDFPVVRYDVLTESVEEPIWKHPNVVRAAALINAANPGNANVFRDNVEKEVQNEPTSFALPSGDDGVFADAIYAAVVRHLMDEVTGFEKEYVVIRRYRRVPQDNSLVASIGEASLIYSTAQLQLPSIVAFSVPDSAALPAPSQDYVWGWRRRPSQVIYDGNAVEQTGEFVLAPWSRTLFYEVSTKNAGW